MNEVLEFSAVLKAVEGTNAMSIDFPYDVQELYGTRGQVKIKATYDGVPYRGSMVNMGGGCHMLVVKIEIRNQIGKNPGDTVRVTVERDLEERIVEVPEDLAAALAANPEAARFYEGLSFTNRKEYAVWVRDAKRTETRSKRLGDAIEKLMKGKRNPGEK
jgi:hypothetical protein